MTVRLVIYVCMYVPGEQGKNGVAMAFEGFLEAIPDAGSTSSEHCIRSHGEEKERTNKGNPKKTLRKRRRAETDRQTDRERERE